MLRTSSLGLLLAVSVALLSAPTPAVCQAAATQGDWWNVASPGQFDSERLAKTPDFIRVDGKRFVDERGETVVFMGMAISDPDKLALGGHWRKSHFERVKSWGADLVRVPVHPVAWRGRGKAAYLELLDQAVVWANELDLYLMIDWHTIGNLQSGLFQHPIYDTTIQETLEFWRTIAARYRGIPTVAFYELFNEPTTFKGQLGTAGWPEWKRLNEEMIRIIFAHDETVIPLVAGFDWAYNLEPVAEAPIEVAGIGYVSHPYPQKVSAPWAEKWQRDFGFVADRYPVFVTEFGYMSADDPGAHTPAIAGDDYGPAIIDFMADRGISWAAWCFDPVWGPRLISDWEYTPTEAGAFFRGVMSGRQ